MTRGQRRAVFICSALVLLGSVLWFYFQPGFEPALAFVGGLGGLAASYWPKRKARYARERLKGRVTFDYSRNNGLYAVGSDGLFFETMWTKAGDTSIHTYNDRPSVAGMALAPDARSIADVSDAAEYDMSSRTVTPQEGEIVVLKNRQDNFAVLQVLDVKDRTRSDDRDEVTFEYSISPHGRTDFSE